MVLGCGAEPLRLALKTSFLAASRGGGAFGAP